VIGTHSMERVTYCSMVMSHVSDRFSQCMQNGIWPRETKYMSIHVRVSRISVGDDKQRGGVEPDVALGITDTRQISTSFGFSCWYV